MCDIIAKWLKAAPERNGKINWHDVAALFQLRLTELNDQNNFIYSDTDCHRHWKYLAYGEILVHDDLNLKAGRKHEDSDEVQHPLLTDPEIHCVCCGCRCHITTRDSFDHV